MGHVFREYNLVAAVELYGLLVSKIPVSSPGTGGDFSELFSAEIIQNHFADLDDSTAHCAASHSRFLNVDSMSESCRFFSHYLKHILGNFTNA